MALFSIPLPPESEQDSDDNLSSNVDEARMMEEHHRGLLLFWKQRRQRLENKIPLDDPFSEFLKGLLSNGDN